MRRDTPTRLTHQLTRTFKFRSISFVFSSSLEVKSCATRRCSTPPGPEGSNGRQRVLCDTGVLDLFLFVVAGGTRPHQNVQPASLAFRLHPKGEWKPGPIIHGTNFPTSHFYSHHQSCTCVDSAQSRSSGGQGGLAVCFKPVGRPDFFISGSTKWSIRTVACTIFSLRLFAAPNGASSILVCCDAFCFH